MARSDGTVDRAEHLVLELLEMGPANLGAATRTFERRPIAEPLWSASIASAAERTRVALEHREVEQVREVDAKVARRLAKAGLIDIVHGVATRRRDPDGPGPEAGP